MKRATILGMATAAALAPENADATEVPLQFTFQGVLTTSEGDSVSLALPMVFRIYAQNGGGSPLWEESHASVAVLDGFFSVTLGSVAPLDESLFPVDADRFLALQVDDDDEMFPRKRIVSVPYSLRASRAATATAADAVGDIAAGEVASVTEVAAAVATHASDPGAHHVCYTDEQARAAVSTLPWTSITDAPSFISSVNGVAGSSGELLLEAGANVSITADTEHHRLTIAATAGGDGSECYARSDFVTSGGAGSADRPILLDASGRVDMSMLPPTLGSVEGVGCEPDQIVTRNATDDGWECRTTVQPNGFATFKTQIGEDVSAETPTDTLTFHAGPGIYVDGDDATDTVSIGVNPGGFFIASLEQVIDRNISWTSGDLDPDRLAGDAANDDRVDVALVGNASTNLAAAAGPSDSGAALIGVYDELANTDASNVQDALDDLDAAISAASPANVFSTIAAPSGSNPVADSATDTLTLVEGSSITISGDSSSDAVTIGVGDDTIDGGQLADTINLDAPLVLAGGENVELQNGAFVLNGSGGTDLEVTEDGLRRSSGSAELLTVENPEAGVLKLALEASASTSASLFIPGGTTPSAPTNGDIWHASSQQTMNARLAEMNQTLVGVVYSFAGDGGTVENTGDETSFSPSFTLPANALVVGKIIRLTIGGYLSNTHDQDELTLRVKLDGSTVATLASANQDIGYGGNPRGIYGIITITCMSVGVSGTVEARGFVTLSGDDRKATTLTESSSGAAAIDTTATNTIEITADWNGNDDSITLRQMIVEVLN